MKKVLGFLFDQGVMGSLKPHFLGVTEQVIDRRLPYPSEEWKQATIKAAAACRGLVRSHPDLGRAFNNLDLSYPWREYDPKHSQQSFFEYAMSFAIFLAWAGYTKQTTFLRELMRCAFLQHVGKYMVSDIPAYLRGHPLLEGLMKPLEDELSRDALCTIGKSLYEATVLERRLREQFALAEFYFQLLYATSRVFVNQDKKFALALLEIDRGAVLPHRRVQFFGHDRAEGLLKPFRGSIAQTLKRAYATFKESPRRIITKEQMLALSSASASLTEAYCRQAHTKVGKGAKK